MQSIARQQHDDWGTRLTRAVRGFASAAALAETRALPPLVAALLRDAGDALSVDCCALLNIAEPPHAGSADAHWMRPGVSSTDSPFDTPALRVLLRHVAQTHQPLAISRSLEDLHDETPIVEAREFLDRTPIRSAVIVPLGLERNPEWVWMLGTVRDDYVWTEAVVEHLMVVGGIVSGILSRGHDGDDHAADMPAPRARTFASSHKPLSQSSQVFEDIIGASPALRTALTKLEEVAGTNTTVLLLGETGTGKELFARALHARGPRRAFPLVSVNCAALPPTLIESELFGHQRGAFTGAIGPRQGRFELAHRGTLFLDEIGDLPLDLQPKLLRVLQEGAFERVGASQTQSVDVRILAATHRDLGQAVADGEFRADLYYRLNVFPIRLPALRERQHDIPALVWAIIRDRQHVHHRDIRAVPPSVIETLQQYSWPGNIRELENVIERALIHSTGDTLTLMDGSFETTEAGPVSTSLTSVERAHIEEVLRDCGWRINGVGNAAERLGLHPNTLRFRMKKLGIVRQTSPRDARHLHSGSAPAARGSAS